MKVSEAYEMALSLDDTTTAQDNSLEVHALNWTNLFLMEVLPNENSIRDLHDEPKLGFASMLTDLSDVVPYHDELVAALPYWIASQIAKSDRDNIWGSRYYDMYYNKINSATPMITKQIDVWGDNHAKSTHANH